ncbi:MAG: hypothetical protein MZV70_42910 [Desulfobacterales bacterium]|nr:hypothetical protein [Desulfobacterales bacterium]
MHGARSRLPDRSGARALRAGGVAGAAARRPRSPRPRRARASTWQPSCATSATRPSVGLSSSSRRRR